ncbi:MAG: hypothetical protein ABSC60_01665 [Acidobacteriota bacterium]|jgi:hypothetical protein
MFGKMRYPTLAVAELLLTLRIARTSYLFWSHFLEAHRNDTNLVLQYCPMKTWLILILLALPVQQPNGRQENAPEKHEKAGKQSPEPSTKSIGTAAPSPITQVSITPQKASSDNQKHNSLLEQLFEALVANWPLVVIGLLGTWAALRTLKAIQVQARIMKKQTKAAEDAAKAAKENTEFLINSERGWMVASNPSIGNRGNLIYSCRVKNIGKTPCKIVEMGAQFRKIDSIKQIPPIPEYGDTMLFNQIVVAPNDSIPTMDAELLPPLLAGEFNAINSGKLFIYRYGFVKYLDIFDKDGNNIREARFCHCLEAFEESDSGFVIRPCIEAPAEYHRAT